MLKQILKYYYYSKIKHWDAAKIRLEHLKKIGTVIGNNTYIFSDEIETAEPYLVTIGSNVMISNGVKFATHDASASFYIDGASDIFGEIRISDHVFIGMGAIVLPGVFIAEGCIIGAGAVVTKSCYKKNMVIAGNPAKVICTVEELREKNSVYSLNTWGKDYNEKKKYLLSNKNRFKGNIYGKA